MTICKITRICHILRCSIHVILIINYPLGNAEYSMFSFIKNISSGKRLDVYHIKVTEIPKIHSSVVPIELTNNILIHAMSSVLVSISCWVGNYIIGRYYKHVFNDHLIVSYLQIWQIIRRTTKLSYN